MQKSLLMCQNQNIHFPKMHHDAIVCMFLCCWMVTQHHQPLQEKKCKKYVFLKQMNKYKQEKIEKINIYSELQQWKREKKCWKHKKEHNKAKKNTTKLLIYKF